MRLLWATLARQTRLVFDSKRGDAAPTNQANRIASGWFFFSFYRQAFDLAG
jgi:hypothetical protein